MMVVFGFLALEKPNMTFNFKKHIYEIPHIFFKGILQILQRCPHIFYKFFKSKRLSTAGRNKPALA